MWPSEPNKIYGWEILQAEETEIICKLIVIITNNFLKPNDIKLAIMQVVGWYTWPLLDTKKYMHGKC